MAEHISVKFRLTATRLFISCKYHDILLTISWPLDDKEYERRINTILNNVPDLVKDGTQEMVVRRELLGIDAELNNFFNQEDRGE